MAFDHVRVWIFDLDNTLYPSECDLFAQVDQRMGAFISDFLDVDRRQARAVQKRFFREHGTTLRGLMNVHGMDPAAFLDYVHDIDVTPVLPDAALDRALGRLPGRKLIFTNGSVEHARRVTERLGVTRHFEAVYDIVAADYVPKPEIKAYRRLIERYSIDPAGAVMFEDIARNLEPAHALGMATVWLPSGSDYGKVGADGDHIDHVTDDLVAWLETAVAG